MTEQEWLACVDQTPMLNILKGKVSDRKLRLYAVASCRSHWRLFPNDQCWEAINLAERFADGTVTWNELRVAQEATLATREWTREQKRAGGAARSVSALAWARVATEVATIPVIVPHFVGCCNFLRDIFGNPFRPITLNPTWLTSTVVALAAGIYEERAFDQMPILADALQDAGCNNEDILNHCRQAGEHVRGCWAIDLLTDRK